MAEKLKNLFVKEDIYSLISKHRTSIMGAASLWIIIFHTWKHVFSDIRIIRFIENFVVRIGFSGVDIFFFLSGIGLVYSIRNKSLGEFYYRRLKRIIFPFVFVGVLHIIFNGWTVGKFVKAVSCYSFFFENIYTFLWFIPAIITLYMVFPFYNRLLQKSKNPVVFTCIVLEIWLIFSLVRQRTMHENTYGFTNRIPIFLLGVLLATISNETKLYFNLESVCWIMVTFILAMYMAYITNYMDVYMIVPTSNAFLPNILITVSLCPILAYIFEKSKLLRKFFGFFGMFTLEFYCVQEWLNVKIMDRLQPLLPTLVANIAFIAVTTVVAYILYKINVLIWKKVDSAVLKKRS